MNDGLKLMLIFMAFMSVIGFFAMLIDKIKAKSRYGKSYRLFFVYG